ncbi:MAG: antibiotic biosynthesis monooxygenase [Rhodoferax sp.]|uniref:putative quinol monooxygenase n=1 Tax=Rhodoferax sp. TaxID=50421 RepID=UPI003264AAF0
MNILSKIAMAYVRWSELEVDPAGLDRFTRLAEENVRETRSTEPGVLAFYWASERVHPNRIRVFEVYADENAYQEHLQSPHFQKFRAGSGPLVTSHQFFEAVPVMLGTKPQLPPTGAVVRIAELEIRPTQLDAYKAIVSEEIDASIRVEPGVFAIHAFALKNRPNHLRLYEIYADERAYLLHRESPHFKRYLEASQDMIIARRLIETAPPVLPLTLN